MGRVKKWGRTEREWDQEKLVKTWPLLLLAYCLFTVCKFKQQFFMHCIKFLIFCIPFMFSPFPPETHIDQILVKKP